ncbi:alcohol dehydrogenase catalytic domain-containing protein [Neisseriaceae bacterium JH1-16]|nr:alcohol dehydrogenase catalytic domain-containing protein [Neisseriaceae bacterium JH1-16]
MSCNAPGQILVLQEYPVPTPAPGQPLVKVQACWVCRTDLHVIDGELPNPLLSIIPGHEIVGNIAALGDGIADFRIGERVGIAWLGHTCGTCRPCRMGRENLCEAARFHGYTLQSGDAEYVVMDARFCFFTALALLRC